MNAEPTDPPVFLLSPARCDGRRAQVLLNRDATFDLATRLRETGASIGEVFSFLSGLYFRGKVAYALEFGRHAAEDPGVLVITTDRGLLTPETPISRSDVERFAGIDLAAGGEGFRGPLRRDAEQLRERIDPRRCVVLLGSIATGKYADLLVEIFGERLLFPAEFV